MKKTLVIGASENPERYSYKAIQMLTQHKHSVEAISLKDGLVSGIKFKTGFPNFEKEEIDTVTLYVGPKNQYPYYDYIISLKPRRVIFNPGTENPELFALLRENGIDFEIACTLVLLSTGAY